MSDEKIAQIEQSTFGATELIQEAEMFVGTDQERMIMQARERYWHDVASRYEDYIVKINALEAEKSSWVKEKSSLLNAGRKSLATVLQVRFKTPPATSLAYLNKIDSSEVLDKLLDVGSSCESYDAFLKNLATYKVVS